MKVIRIFLTENPCYTANRKIAVKGLMLHSVSCAQPDAKKFIRSWNNSSYDRCCVHAFIDGNDGTVYQTLPWDMRGWHCGADSEGSANNTHIGVEMCEPSCLVYSEEQSFVCTDTTTAIEVVERTYRAAVELFATLCVEYRLNPLEDGTIISHAEGHRRGIASGHADPEHLWNGLGLPYSMDSFRKAVRKEIPLLRPQRFIELVGPLAAHDMRMTGILASVTIAQAILESGYGASDLARNAKNLFGMQCSLSGNSWTAVWDQKESYAKKTSEQDADGTVSIVDASFRKYPNFEDSVEDHSRYLLQSTRDGAARYKGLSGCGDYRQAAQIIAHGGYSTDLAYADKLCDLIERWQLTRFDEDT